MYHWLISNNDGYRVNFLFSKTRAQFADFNARKNNGFLLGEFKSLPGFHSFARANRGYSLLELLLALSILAIVTSLIIPSLITVDKMIEKQKMMYQDEIGIYQLQLLLAENTIIEINADSIIYESSKNECEISLVNGNIISQPGWLCFITNVDDMYIDEILGVIYLEYERGKETYSFPIGYSQQ